MKRNKTRFGLFLLVLCLGVPVAAETISSGCQGGWEITEYYDDDTCEHLGHTARRY